MPEWMWSEGVDVPPAAPDCGGSGTRHHHYQTVIRE
jgi:hypothetical protein